MVYIFYTCCGRRLNNDTFNYYLKKLPFSFRIAILRYRHWEDAQRSLLGKALLLDGLHYLGLKQYFLEDLKVSRLKKPYFDDSIDFNISHSGEFIVCAVSLHGNAGVDIEEIKQLVIEEFEMYFSTNEWNQIMRSPDSVTSFYKYWTQKEAFLKAIGMGLTVPIKDVEIFDNKIIWENNEWFIQEIKLDKKCIAHLCRNTPSDGLIIKKINYN
jgi:4'-phosphopantetheinyl transferase